MLTLRQNDGSSNTVLAVVALSVMVVSSPTVEVGSACWFPLVLPHALALSTPSTSFRIPKPPTVSVLPPGSSFRSTVPGEVSVASMNILAPSYHWIGHPDRTEMEAKDREERIPLAVQMASSSQADILCMQEVEGGSTSLLKELLKQHGGYDSLVWEPLYPNRHQDQVGLAIAWRSSRHQLLSSSSNLKRAMVVQLQELDSGATMLFANVHLPAKPSAIIERLRTVSKVVRTLEGYERRSKPVSSLDGSWVLTGDFNCEPQTITTRLVMEGKIAYGTLFDRNYRKKITKDAAAKLSHPHAFRDVYDKRQDDTAITVSLHGRGAGCMDQMFLGRAGGDMGMSPTAFIKSQQVNAVTGGSKRRSRRQRGEMKQKQANMEVENKEMPLRVEALLATTNASTVNIVRNGLPNVEHGFPSDHLPIGALFVPEKNYEPRQPDEGVNPSDTMAVVVDEKHSTGGLSANARRRQENYAKSIVVRRRHNTILRKVAEWLETTLGASHMIRDQPLWKWEWTDGLDPKRLKRKMRAPDMCCILGNSTLAIVEVTVCGTKSADAVRKEKVGKYSDLSSILQQAPNVLASPELKTVAEPFILVMEESGEVPPETQADLEALALLVEPHDEAKAKAMALKIAYQMSQMGEKLA